jgi:hypothetical protein
MKKQLLILASILIVVFFSAQFAAAAKIDTSVSSDDTHRLSTGGNNFSNTVTFLPTTTTHVNYAGSIFSDRFNAGKRSNPIPFKNLVSLTNIPLFISQGTHKNAGFLALATEKVVLGSPTHNRFSYPAIAFRIKF